VWCIPSPKSLRQQPHMNAKFQSTHRQPFACKRMGPWSCRNSLFRDAPERRASSGCPPQRLVGMRGAWKTFCRVCIWFNSKGRVYMSFWGLLTWIKSLWLVVWVGQLCVRFICCRYYSPKSWCPIDTASLVSSKCIGVEERERATKEVIESQVSHRR
jgi:hypothetical protein